MPAILIKHPFPKIAVIPTPYKSIIIFANAFPDLLSSPVGLPMIFILPFWSSLFYQFSGCAAFASLKGLPAFTILLSHSPNSWDKQVIQCCLYLLVVFYTNAYY